MTNFLLKILKISLVNKFPLFLEKKSVGDSFALAYQFSCSYYHLLVLFPYILNGVVQTKYSLIKIPFSTIDKFYITFISS